MVNEIKVTNMIMSGKLPFKKINYEKIISESDLKWFIPCNENQVQMISTQFKKKNEKTRRNKQRCVYITVWNSGAINITGLTSIEEGEKYFKIIKKEIKKINEKQKKKEEK